MIRRTLIAAALVALAGPALADGLSGGRAVSNTNSFSASNTAAGIGNHAVQGVIATQKGPMGKGGPLFNSNQARIDNTAAGVGNKAVQGVDLIQKGSRRGPMSNANAFDASNLSAGVGNFAGQGLYVTQK